jgi:general secretion pathway protein M
MKVYLERLREWFAALAPRERLLVSICAVFVGATLVYAGGWLPLKRAHENRAQALAESRALAQRLESAAVDAQRLRGNGGARANRNLSLLAVVDQATKNGTLGRAPSRLQPEGDTEVRVWVEDVSFEALVRWLADLEARQGVTVLSADIEKQTAPGTVNVRLSLTRP